MEKLTFTRETFSESMARQIIDAYPAHAFGVTPKMIDAAGTLLRNALKEERRRERSVGLNGFECMKFVAKEYPAALSILYTGHIVGAIDPSTISTYVEGV
jgi:hypothetical protein